MPERPVAVKTIVSTPMASAVARTYGVEMIDVLTGFKFIGEQITLLEEKGEADRYIFGFEESCGYMSGVHVRDKDAVNACMLIAELAAACKAEGVTIVDRLEALYERYGFFENSLLEFTMEGESGMARIARIMKTLREGAPAALFRRPAAEVADYLVSRRRLIAADGGTEREEPISLPRSDVLAYVFANGDSIIIRPSGTEPKLKIYLAVLGKTGADAENGTRTLQQALRALVDGIR
jgi:phosphoglucomutase